MNGQNNKMDLNLVKQHEYDAQLFGFTVEDFMAAIKLLVKEEVTSFSETLTKTIIKKYTSDDPEIEQVKIIAKSLVDHYIHASVEPLKDLEVQLRELLNIPPHVLLPQDSVQRNQYSMEDEQEMDDQLNDLLRRLKRTKCFAMELRQELKMLRDIIPVLSQRVQECEHVMTEVQEAESSYENMDAPFADIVSHRLNNLNINSDLSS